MVAPYGKKIVFAAAALLAAVALIIFFAFFAYRFADFNGKQPFSEQDRLQDISLLFPGYKSAVVVAPNMRISVAVADTDYKKTKGLGGVTNLPENSGMLFVFENSDFHPFWMKGMKIPIDIVWINENYQVVYLEENVKPESYPNVFMPDKKARFVLEISAGSAEKSGLSFGNTLKVENL